MKFAVTAIMILTITQPVFAEKIGTSGVLGDDDFEFGPKSTATAAPAKVAPMPKVPVPLAKPVKPQEDQIAKLIKETESTPAVQSNAAGMVKMVPQADGCPMPQMTAEAQKTPLKVFVDQETQTVKVVIDGKEVNLGAENKVSTGGTLKVPDGELNKDPYCAQTPAMHRVVSMVKESDFANTSCTEEQKRWRSTVFPVYHSKTFGDKKTGPIPMPKAIRIDGGIFLHQVPGKYQEALGNDISGECVRLHPNTAAFLYKQMEKYGAIDVTVSPPRQHKQGDSFELGGKQISLYCDQRHVDWAIAKRNDPNAPAPVEKTGSEGVQGAPDGFQTVVTKIFDPFGLFGKNKDGIMYKGTDKTPAVATQPTGQPHQPVFTPPRPSKDVGRKS